MAAFSQLLDLLAEIPDPRRAGGKLYQLPHTSPLSRLRKNGSRLPVAQDCFVGAQTNARKSSRKLAADSFSSLVAQAPGFFRSLLGAAELE